MKTKKQVVSNQHVWRIALLVAVSLFVHQSLLAQPDDIQKKYSDVSPVKKGAMVEFYNKFGEIQITTWDKNEVSVEVTMKAWGSSEDAAKKLLDRIEIKKVVTDGNVSYSTMIASEQMNNSSRSGFEINYKVSLPSYLELNVGNKYGAVYLGDMEGPVRLDVQYDKLKTGRLLNSRNEITVKYGSADIDEVKNARVDTKYCKYVSIKKAGDLDVEDKYNGNFEVGEVNNLKGTSSYGKIAIGKLSGTLYLVSKYGSGTVTEVAEGFKEIDIECSYGSLDLGFIPACSFDFDVQVRYGSFRNSLSDVDTKKRIEQNTSSEYGGTKGKTGVAKVKLVSAYGSIKIH